MPTLSERHDTSQNPIVQRRVKMAALRIAVAMLTSPAPTPPTGNPPTDADQAAYHSAMVRRDFASRVAGDPDTYAPRIAMVLLASVPDADAPNIAGNTAQADAALLQAMNDVFKVYVG